LDNLTGPAYPSTSLLTLGMQTVGQPDTDTLDQLQSINRQNACRQKQKEAKCTQKLKQNSK